MFTKPIEKTLKYLEKRTLEFGEGCKRVYISLSGGVDSAVVVTILCRVFGPKNVVAMYRDIRSNPEHERDVDDLAQVLGFNLVKIDANPLYDMFLEQCSREFEQLGLGWCDENSDEATEQGWAGAYASAKSRFATPMAGFISKAIDAGGGRIFGTGNAEEDVLLRYYDKYGDGAVDNNILVGLTKMEVRQLALFFAKEYQAEVLCRIAYKIPSADLQANGNQHNDENELTTWAHNMGYNIQLSYGTCDEEGNIAWVLKQDLDNGVVTGDNQDLDAAKLQQKFGYCNEEVQVIEFMRKVERASRHKDAGVPGVTRQELRALNLVD